MQSLYARTRRVRNARLRTKALEERIRKLRIQRALDPHTMSGRVAARLARVQITEQDPWLRDDYRQALLTVLYAASGSPI